MVGGRTTFIVLFMILCCKGNQPVVLLKFLQNFNMQHMDFINFNSMTFEVKDLSDKSLSILIQELEKQTKPITIEYSKYR